MLRGLNTDIYLLECMLLFKGLSHTSLHHGQFREPVALHLCSSETAQFDNIDMQVPWWALKSNWDRQTCFWGQYGKETYISQGGHHKYGEPRKKGDVHTSTIFRAAPKSCALCQENNSIVLSKCNSAILLWPLPCFVLALITVEEHMVTEPEV